jgi:hypothetical protein
MAVEGVLELDCAIFADTQWEPREVYEHLDEIEMVAGWAGIRIHRVTAGNLRERALSTDGRFVAMPLYVSSEHRSGMLSRQCTNQFKVRPIQRKLRELGATRKGPVDLVMGISRDEAQRMRDSRVQYIRHHYPLVDLGMTRADCLTWLREHGYPEPPKSACIGCPFNGNAVWRLLRDQRPEEWADAVDFDRRVRDRSGLDARAYLHRQLVPLEMADIDPPRGIPLRGLSQLPFDADAFSEECSGVCGV